MFKTIEAIIRILTPEIQKLVDLEFEKVNNNPPPGSNLDQVYLKGGDRLIFEYLDAGEYGVALEHLLYMIEETNISISDSQKGTIIELAKKMRMKINL